MTFFFKKSYTEAAFLPIIIFMGFMVVYSMPLGMVANAIKKPYILLISKVSIILNLAIGIPLAKYYGAAGMATATAFSVLTKNIIIYIYTRKHVKIQIPFISFLKSIINTGLTILIMHFFSKYVDVHVLIDATLSGILYLLIQRFNPVFSPEQKKVVTQLVPKKASRFVKFAI